MQDFISEIMQSRFQVPLVAFITVIAVYGTLKELRRSRGDFAEAYLFFAFCAACFIGYGWFRGSETPYSYRFTDAFGSFVIMVLPGFMLYVRNASFIDRFVPWWAYLAIAAVNVGCAMIPFTVRLHSIAEDDKIANHGVSAGFVCVFISLWVLTQLPFETKRLKRRLCLLLGVIGYVGALGYLAKYLVWYYLFYPFFFVQIFMLVSASRKFLVWVVIGFVAIAVALLTPKLTSLALGNRSDDLRSMADYIDYKVTRSWLDTDYKILGLSDGGRLNLWKEYFDDYSESPMLGLGFGYRSTLGIMEHSLPLFMIFRAGVLGCGFLLVYLYYNYRIWKFLAGYHPRIRRMARVLQIFFNLSMCFTTIYSEVYILTAYYSLIGTMLGRDKSS